MPYRDKAAKVKHDAEYRAAHRERINARMAVYYVENRARILEREARAYADRRDEKLARNARWKAANPEKARASSDAWFAANPDHLRAYRTARYAEHRESIRTVQAAYHAAHPEVMQAANARRRARKRGADVNDLTHAQWEAIKSLYRYICVYCGKRPRKLTQDHITPLVKGGNHTVSNVVPSCAPCNSRKCTNLPPVPVQPPLLV